MKRILIILFLVALPLSIPKICLAKDYYFPKITSTYNIDVNGYINVLEQRTYSFSGSFSWADIYIPLKVERKGNIYDIKIQNFNVTEDDKPVNLSTSYKEDGKCY